MADRILYVNKEKLLDDITIPNKNKVTANDMNEIKEVVNAHADDIEELETNKANKTEIPTDLSQLSNETTKFANETQLANAILEEKTERQNADNNLQTQIDGIVAQSDVVDIVGTYQELLSYDTTKLTENDIIKVLSDSTHNNATSYYRWENNSWAYVGSEGPYYTKGETDERLNQKANQSSLNETNQNVSALSGRVGTNESDIRDIKAEQITQNTQIATLIADSGNKIELSVNSTNYVMTATLKNKAGEILSTSSIDLPIESMIINARYDSATKELVLTLQNGNTIRVSIADIIDGLVSQSDFDDLVVRVENIEEEQITQNESIEELQEQVEILENTVDSELEDATATGESITVNDSANAPAKLLPSGNTFQQQYEGKNVINVSDKIGSITNTYFREFGTNYELTAETTYTFSCKTNVQVTPFKMSVGCGDTAYTTDFIVKSNLTNGRNYITFTPTEQQLSNGANLFFRCPRYSEVTSTTYEITDIQLEIGSSMTDYEPYVGGQASPSPDYPQTIHNVSGDNEFIVQNKNLFDKATIIKNYELVHANGELRQANNWWVSDYIPIKENTTYYLSGAKTQGNTNCFYDKNKNYISGVRAITNASITSPAGAQYLRINGFMTELNSNIQIEEGTTATPYIEHKGETAEFTLVEGQKMFLEDYLADDGIHHVGGERVYNGSESGWEESVPGTNTYRFRIEIGYFFASGQSGYCNSNKFVRSGVSSDTELAGITVGFLYYRINKNIIDGIEGNSNVAKFKTWLSNNPMTIQTKLTNETIEPYTQTQQAQYNKLKKIMSYFEQTNVNTITAGDLEAILTLGYKKSNRLRIDALEQAIISLGGNI